MCFRQITQCDRAILSITLLHDEDMPPFGTHGKKRVDTIVQLDAVGGKKANGDSLTIYVEGTDRRGRNFRNEERRDMNYWRGDSEDIEKKLSAEMRANNPVVDVVEGTGIGELAVRAGFAQPAWSCVYRKLRPY
jgi:hypothetical protein